MVVERNGQKFLICKIAKWFKNFFKSSEQKTIDPR